MTQQSPSRAGPTLLYGTAWKENDTASLTSAAIDVGFRGIDTANQRKHYFEAGVGEALAAAITAGSVTREEIFLQTKFTYARGQDERLPYDPRASLADQVAQSFASSLEHLQTTYVDSYVLHGPWQQRGLTAEDWETWSAIESLAGAAKVRQVGISNVTLPQLEELCGKAKVKPAVVQNRCYATTGWDHAVRAFCRQHGIVYQGFSLLTANREALVDARVWHIAARLNKTVQQVVFRFAVDAGMVVLCGTTNRGHMTQALEVERFKLTPDDIRIIESIGAPAF